ncbi:MAG: hypothetical protein LBS57_01830 [Treponema sp.]|jgi:hypothetical protein|nr:hypothetical protein [Treponema sp.]
MKNTIKEKLKKIKDIYPEENLNARKERWRRMWRGEPALDRYPFVFYPPIVDYYNTVYTSVLTKTEAKKQSKQYHTAGAVA